MFNSPFKENRKRTIQNRNGKVQILKRRESHHFFIYLFYFKIVARALRAI